MVKASSGNKAGPRTDPEAIERRRMQNRLAQRKRRLKRAQMAREEKERQQRLQAAQAASQLTFINDGYRLSLNQPPVCHAGQQKILPPVVNNYFDYTPLQFEDVFSSSPYFPRTPIPPFETDPTFLVNGYPSPSSSHAPSTPTLSLYTPSLIDEDLSNNINSSSNSNIDLDPSLYLSSQAGVVSPSAKTQHPWDAFGLMPLQPVSSPVLQGDRNRSTSLPTPFTTPPRSVPSLSTPRVPPTPNIMQYPPSSHTKNMNMRTNGLNLFNTSIDTSPHAGSSSINMKSNLTTTPNKTGLHICAEQGNTHAANLLLGYGADIDAIDEYGRTPLHYAVTNRHTHIVKLLVERGATTTIADINGVNPMHIAADSGEKEMTQMMHMMIMMTPPVVVPGAHNINLHSGPVVLK
ncbi:ankyrin repeat domain protein, putative [Talaromyces stipitatus ATCC 10500]|uniref:Ankyrin repeat domain protein, putative n=1 Tax=Talaromyces stipitatus (strain ATCC 10500 / CBS 375.48 / QM 6759 / NRRL 1006) TaxID=441959 RepID=B8M332_TALSN|nr:ankyrin repeat domain protein, putative [Talaromyces stipitatus ATCC 10500]EED22008.1 ankyrin repeat domain protein, putative [Talaromyces stipitatus ATCC 10500]